MNQKHHSRPSGNTGFTLIELLVVITIVSLLLAVAAPAIFNGLQSTRLSGAGDRMLSSLSEAQQTAFSQNCVVEVRFYSYAGMLNPELAFRSFRLFKVSNPPGANTEVTTSLGAIVNLPDGVIISADAELSPALAGSTIADAQQDSGVMGATYAAIRFLPDGTCRKVASTETALATMQFLNLTQSFLTLLEDDGIAYAGGNLPKNFVTIQTDPYTGKSRSYRPGF